MTIDELARRIGAVVRGDGSTRVVGCATLDAAGPDQVSFLANRKYASQVAGSRAGAVILAASDADSAASAEGRTFLISADPYFAFRQAMVVLHGWREHPTPGIDPHAYVDSAAEVHELCTIRPFVYIAPRARIGKRCVIYPHCYVGKDAVIGDDCVLYPGVTIYDGCTLGDRVTLHAGCVIGQDGFGYATHPAEPNAADGSRGAEGAREAGEGGGEVIHHKIPQSGNVVIEDDVEMGANCSVDRATLGSTVIGRGTKFSNGVTIGHGTEVGAHNLYVAQVGLAGSVQTGRYVVMGGQVGVAGHLKIGDGVQIAAMSGVMTDVPDSATFGGAPAISFTEMKRILIQQQRLPDMAATLKRMQRRIDQLEAKLDAQD